MLSKYSLSLATAALLAIVGPQVGVVSILHGAERASTIAWGDDLDAALRQASQTGQPVLAHFYSEHCVPCKLLEAKAFKNPELGETMARSVLPVKINYDQHRDIAKRYQITRFPTDLFLHPNGEEAYRTVSPQDPADYCKLVERIAIKNRDWVVDRMSKLAANDSVRPTLGSSSIEANLARDQRPVSTKSQNFQTPASDKLVEPEPNTYCMATDGPTTPAGIEASAPTVDGPFHLASSISEVKGNRYQRPLSQEPNQAASATHASAAGGSNTASSGGAMAAVTMGGVFSEENTLALDGYCPVSLVTKKAWMPGTESYSVKHRGRIYQCASEEARQQFLQEPDRYSPILSGYDVVHFLETGELIAGKREYGCEYLGRVFVFMNAANKAHFDIHAMHYTQNIDLSASAGRIANGTSGSALQR